MIDDDQITERPATEPGQDPAAYVSELVALTGPIRSIDALPREELA